MPRENIRVSQFVLTYGPGAIRESQYGPRVILEPGCGLFGDTLSPERLEIGGVRLPENLGSLKVFRPPTPEEGRWRTKPFPEWRLCTECWILYRTRCPSCGTGRRSQAIRFVLACPAGHLDDLDWNRLVHGATRCGRTDGFEWRGGHASVGRITLVCPSCGKQRSMADAYSMQWPCSGRRPEREPPDSPASRPGCSSVAQVIQRQSVNLRVADILSVLTVPPRHTALHRLLSSPPVLSYLAALGDPSQVGNPDEFERFLDAVRNQARRGLIPEHLPEALGQCSPEEIAVAALDLLERRPETYRELLQEEMDALLKAAVRGSGGDSESFRIDPSRVRRIRSEAWGALTVAPVSRLRVTLIQTGYRRFVGPSVENVERVDIGWQSSTGDVWYPGIQYVGEGILIFREADRPDPVLRGDAFDAWSAARDDRSLYGRVVFRSDDRDELHPGFVWWHTFSHLIIRALGRHSGYGAAAIRERIYFRTAGSGVQGALLLYTAHPGSEASLGGLVGLVPGFETVLNLALEHLLYCSNGHLCESLRFRPGSHGGAACYGCCIVSETSCDHRNMWLDRHILLENLP